MHDSGPSHANRPGRVVLRLRLRTNLHGLVFVMSGFAVLYGIHRAVSLLPIAPYRSTYRSADFVVDRVVPVDEGTPERSGSSSYWAEGRVEPGDVATREPVSRTLDGTLVMSNDSAVPAAAGQRTRVWFSSHPAAPMVSVAQFPCLPESRTAAFWVAFAIGSFFAGLRLTMRAGEYLQRTYFAEKLVE